jgi:hypothetical protein
MAGVSQALKRIKSDLGTFLPDESILAACRAAGHQWRERQLGPVQTLHLFLLQVMACNSAITHLRLLAVEVFSAAAFCEARIRLPLAALQKKWLSARVADGWLESTIGWGMNPSR